MVLGGFLTYINVFLLYLITRFAKGSNANFMQDEILGKKVSCLVYVMNQSLLAEIVHN